jgi:hypothetical protein
VVSHNNAYSGRSGIAHSRAAAVPLYTLERMLHRFNFSQVAAPTAPANGQSILAQDRPHIRHLGGPAIAAASAANRGTSLTQFGQANSVGFTCFVDVLLICRLLFNVKTEAL